MWSQGNGHQDFNSNQEVELILIKTYSTSWLELKSPNLNNIDYMDQFDNALAFENVTKEK